MSKDELIDEESRIRYTLPDNHEKPIWYVNYVSKSKPEEEGYFVHYANSGPMTWHEASAVYDRMDEGSITLVGISKEPLSGWEKKF